MFILMLLISFAQAENHTPALGVSEDSDKAFFTVSDFAKFPINYRNKFGDYRYGFGTGQMMIGSENVGYSGKSRNGLTVYGLNSKPGIGSHVGLDIFDAEFKVNSNRAYNNYYMYQPGISTGMVIDFDGIAVMINSKMKESITNYYITSGWTPKYDPAYGYSVLVDVYAMSLTYEELNFANLNRKTFDVNVGNNLHLFEEKDELNTIKGISWRRPL